MRAFLSRIFRPTAGTRRPRGRHNATPALEAMEGRRLLASARVTLSVISEVNATPAPVTYQIQWKGQASWQTFTLAAGQGMVHTSAIPRLTATVRFDESYAAGFQGRDLKLPSKPFVAAGREGWTPNATSDGMPFAFAVNPTRTGLVETARTQIDTARRPEMRPQVLRSFPGLQGNFEVLGPSTPDYQVPGVTDTYNCIAWSEGITSRHEWPGERVADFDQLYGRLGYVRLSTIDTRLVDGVQKITLYALNGKATHASAQDLDGTWSSKLGSGPLIRHAAADVFGGSIYGRPVAVYARTA